MEELSAYLAGDLDDELRGKVQKAIENDPELQASINAIERSLQFLREHGEVEAPEGLHDTIMAALADESIPGRRHWYQATVGAVILAAAAATLLIVLPQDEMDHQRPEDLRTAPAEIAEAKKEATSQKLDAKPASMPMARPALRKEKAHKGMYPTLDEAPPPPVSAARAPAARPAPAPMLLAEDEEEEDAPAAMSSDMTEGLGGLVGAKGTQIGAGGLSSRGSGLGGGGTADELGGLGTKGIGSGRSGYGKGGGSLGDKNRAGVTTSDPTILGALDKSLIDGVVKKHMNQIRYCYERELATSPSLGGKMIIKSVIGTDGAVSEASVDSSTLGNTRVEDCVVQRFMRMQFPEPKGDGAVIVSYPLSFSPG